MSGNGQTRKPGEKLVPPEGMTKSAYKKLLRKQRHAETKEQYREHRKQLKKQKDAERKAEIEKLKAKGEPYEHLLKPRNKNKLHKKIEYGDVHIEANPIENKKKIGIVIDCAYDDYMNEKEVVSLSSQITRAYSTNRTAVKAYYDSELARLQDESRKHEKSLNEKMGIAPSARLVISGVDKRLKKRFDKVLPDYANWDPECAVLTEVNLTEVLDNWDGSSGQDYSNVVYLLSLIHI